MLPLEEDRWFRLNVCCLSLSNIIRMQTMERLCNIYLTRFSVIIGGHSIFTTLLLLERNFRRCIYIYIYIRNKILALSRCLLAVVREGSARKEFISRIWYIYFYISVKQRLRYLKRAWCAFSLFHKDKSMYSRKRYCEIGQKS